MRITSFRHPSCIIYIFIYLWIYIHFPRCMLNMIKKSMKCNQKNMYNKYSIHASSSSASSSHKNDVLCKNNGWRHWTTLPRIKLTQQWKIKFKKNIYSTLIPAMASKNSIFMIMLINFEISFSPLDITQILIWIFSVFLRFHFT
jgi:hypothetical protein